MWQELPTREDAEPLILATVDDQAGMRNGVVRNLDGGPRYCTEFELQPARQVQ